MKAYFLNRHVMEVAGMWSFDNLDKTDVILSSSEAEDLKAAVSSIGEATFWMDWWTFAMKFISLNSSSEVRLVWQLSLAGTRCQLLVAKTISTVWANLVLKCRDAVLVKVTDSYLHRVLHGPLECQVVRFHLAISCGCSGKVVTCAS